MKPYLLIILPLATIACVDSELHSSLSPTTSIIPHEQVKGIDPQTLEISEEDAAFVALTSNTHTKSSFNKRVANIVTYYCDNGDPAFYAINYENQLGYTLISATKNYYPVLAISEYGCFPPKETDSGTLILVNQYIKDISLSKECPEDSLLAIRSQWVKYERSNNAIVSTRTGGSINEVINTNMAEWINNDYMFSGLSEGALHSIPEDVFQRFINVAQGLTHPDYDPLDYSYLLVKYSTNTYQRGPYLTTSWHQEYPYNQYIPIVNSHQVVGCCGVAAGQIIAFHQKPTSYASWSSISNGDNTEIATLLYNVANGVNTDYSNGASDIINVKNYLTALGYQCSRVYHSLSTTLGSLNLSYPVFMSGVTPNHSGHAWVCDGYQDNMHTVEYILKIIPLDEPLRFVTADTYTVSSDSYLFHMNWGSQSVYPGWYTDSGSSSDWPSGIDNCNFSDNRQDLIHIHY